MPFNGSGNYVAPSSPGAFNPAISGQQADPSSWNTLLDDLETALSTTITRDGQSTITANIPWAGFKITGLGAGTAATDAVNVGQIQSNVTNYADDTGAADLYAIAPTPAVSAYAVGQPFSFKAANTNLTTTPTLAVSGLTPGIIKWANGTALAASDIPASGLMDVITATVVAGTPTFHLQTPANFVGTGALVRTTNGTVNTQAVGDTSTKVASTAFVSAALRSYLAGLTLSTAGSSATFGVAVGQATDSTNLATLALTSAFTKTTSAWALGTGNGGIDTGAIANTTWYHVYLIKRPDTAVVDVTFSLNATTPTLPANYTLYRRIGAMKTNGSAQWVKFIQVGDEFLWDAAPTLDVDAANPGTSAVTRTLTGVPTGVIVWAIMNVAVTVGAAGTVLLLSPLSISDQAPSSTATPLGQLINGVASSIAGVEIRTQTNTSAALRSRFSADDGSVVLKIAVQGWVDHRGRDT